jgi:transcriptional regulator of acetoin/glycerol metabolism
VKVRLQAHAWPGNIRELHNVLDRARLFADDGIVRAAHLPDAPGREGWSAGLASAPLAAAAAGQAVAWRRGPITDDELRQHMAAAHGILRQLADQLGLSERTLYRRLKARVID